MNEASLALSGMAGALLGAAFFGGLWWTVRKMVSADRPGLLLLGSLLARTSVALAGFYLVAGGRAERLIACLLGFAVASVAARQLGRPPDSGARHAR